MKKLLLAGFMLTVGGYAQATVTTAPGSPVCSGGVPNTCQLNAVCTNPPCQVNNTVQTGATCTASGAGPSPFALVATAVGPPTNTCTWFVQDGDAIPISVTIDNGNGLPVELESFSVE